MGIDLDKIILQAYDKIGYTPRNGQEKIVKSILEVFVTQGKRNVILSADTGIGKSIIGAVVSESLSIIKNPKLASVIMMHQNSLAKQYADTFKNLSDNQYFQIKGAKNYPCSYMKEVQFKPDATGEDCMFTEIPEMESKKHCYNCEYKRSRKMIQSTQNLITNYSMMFISKLSSGHIPEHLLQVYDEAHVLNEVFCDHTAIVVSAEKIEGYIKELKTHGNNKFDDCITDLTNMMMDIKSKSVDNSNYKEKLKDYKNVYYTVSIRANSQAALIPDIKDKLKFKKMEKKYGSLAGTIADFLNHEYDHVFDDTKYNEVSVRAVFIKGMMNMVLGEYNLFMSATISKDFATETFGLDPDDTVYIDAPQVFPSENRPLLFLGKEKLNYTNMKEPETITQICNQVNVITKFHADKNDKGIILVPSFALTKTISSAITGCTVFEHVSGMKIMDLMEEFKNYKGPSVLISPSIYEGLDFKGDISRFQIIVKTPYPSLGDKRIEYIAKHYGNIYKELALLKIIQGIGRSIRSAEDTATTYFLDASSKQLYDSRINVWKKRFVVKT